jgi:hypothetical protein
MSARETRPAIVWILSITVSLVASAPAQDHTIATEDTQRPAEIRDPKEWMANAEPLCDVVGPRLTGSAAQRTGGARAE